MARIGFIGLGNMGGPMAANLVKAGHTVKGYDLSEASAARFAEIGGTVVGSAGEAAADVDAVVSMLPEGAHVIAVYTGPGGVIERAAPGTLFIDSSTIHVEAARQVAAAAAKAGMAMVDAPVSGGTGGAAAGTLTFMVGGADEAFERARPILECMGKTIVHAGGAGNGQAAKICNNMILGISMIAVSEAFALADKLGLDHQKLFDIASKSSGQCWSLTTYCPVPGPVPTSPANRGYAPGFTAAMMLKDLKLAQDVAGAAGAVTPLGAEAAQLYRLYVQGGHAGVDFSGIVRMLQGA
ncbi:3-hydroxyisobutyrate dehydrogenase [Prosthecomicrobium hirschii]|uniref:3-hydroxyisobutyrate dehydrogenase n=1 Tax=Prosthecodimorpha hirschii TaxID=665126 RepID=A0A0P6VQ73_9HYPH|nr:3-hydroxyisobutyrate dehydrogenase [Prosthecomicrobium hirschii]KPL54942.1 3-hydroxyisobutyrate dehydrogenase [Prosthecomicrobium hirschii]